MAVVADTHAIIWYITEPNKLSNNAFIALEKAANDGDFIYLSAISLVEICYLVEKGRLPAIVLQRLTEVLTEPEAEIAIVPLDLAIGLTIQNLDRDTVPDMPDRIIAATAYHLKLPLITRDQKIQALQNIRTIW
ncbi:MAG TPA: type II toxin-antitoxin system VapC family toxin [Methylococcales bacterium]